MTIRIGDTAKNFIQINIENNTDFEINKIVLQCGSLRKEYTYVLDTPILISFSKEETANFKEINTIHLAAYNNTGEKKTLEGEIIFKADRQIVNNE